LSGLQSFWRAHTDNDNGGSDTLTGSGADCQLWGPETGMPSGRKRVDGVKKGVLNWFYYWGDISYGAQWTRCGLDRLQPVGVSVEVEDAAGCMLEEGGSADSVVIKVRYTLVATGTKTKIVCSTSMHVLPDGEVLLHNECSVPAGLPPMARVGMLLTTPDALDRVTYLGHGPVENYVDRRAGSAVGRYSTTVDDMFVPYLVPSENGSRGGVRWASLEAEHSDAGACKGLMFAPGNSEDTLSFSAHRCTPWDLHVARHVHELPRRPAITLTIEHRQMPCGGNDSWSRSQSKQYLIQPGTYSYSIRLRPLATATAPQRPPALSLGAVAKPATFQPAGAASCMAAKWRVSAGLLVARTPLGLLEGIVMLTDFKVGAPVTSCITLVLALTTAYAMLWPSRVFQMLLAYAP